MGLPEERTPAAVASYVLDILTASEHTPYIGEPISQLQHSLQCGTLATDAGADEETQVAALLHDVGQFAPAADLAAADLSRGGDGAVRNLGEDGQPLPTARSVGRTRHDGLGAAFLLSLGFPDKVARLVGAHVEAKRYLCAVDPSYHARLSDASKRSLTYQGGPMAGDERDSFAADPWCADMCRLRVWDDEAKVEGLEVPGAEAWRARLERMLVAGERR